MSFYPLYQFAHVISPAVRGLGRMIEGGKWVHWCGDGAWRNLTPPMEEWNEVTEGPLAGIRGLEEGRTLQFSRYDREVQWPRKMYGERYPLTAVEQEYLYAIYERVYLLPERLAAEEQRRIEKIDRVRREQQWLGELSAAGMSAVP